MIILRVASEHLAQASPTPSCATGLLSLNFFHCARSCTVWYLLSLPDRKLNFGGTGCCSSIISSHSFFHTITLLGPRVERWTGHTVTCGRNDQQLQCCRGFCLWWPTHSWESFGSLFPEHSLERSRTWTWLLTLTATLWKPVLGKPLMGMAFTSWGVKQELPVENFLALYQLRPG